jgi:alpha-galactosidase
MRKNIRQFSGPNHWNDFDMMEVGHGMSENEDRAHFSMWCMLASPLMAGNDLRSMKKETINILTDKEAIAINQDTLGVQAYLLQQKDSVDTWIKPLANNEVAICFLNRSTKPVVVNYNFSDNPIVDTVSNVNINFKNINYFIRDIWMKKNIGTTKNTLNAVVKPHDVILLRLSLTSETLKKKKSN